MLRFIFLIFLWSGFYTASAQNDEMQKILAEIKMEGDTVENIFRWVASNITYDLAKAQKIENPKKRNSLPKFKNEKDHKAYALKQILATRTGVCEDYSLLLDRLWKEAGYVSYVVVGYSKNQHGNTSKKIGHTWNAVRVNGKWKLYDPTWAAGTVRNKSKFVPNYNPQWADLSPMKMIESHMPFDPVWQFLENPITYEEFAEDLQNVEVGNSLEVNPLIDEFLDMDAQGQMRIQLTRSKGNGKANAITRRWQNMITNNLAVRNETEIRKDFNEAQEKYNQSVDLLNEFLKAKSMQFRGEEYEIASANKKLNMAQEKIKKSKIILESLKIDSKKGNSSINRALKYTQKLEQKIAEEVNEMGNQNGQ